MLPLYQAEELARQRYAAALVHQKLIHDYGRAVRHGRARVALERALEESIRSGASLGELKRDVIAVLHRVAE